MAARLQTTLAAILTAVAAISAAAAADRDIVVTYDQSRILDLGRLPKEIIIGNASIADVTIQSGKLVITGKTFGVTNFIALDDKGATIRESRVIVQRDETRVVNLHKGGKRQSYNCIKRDDDSGLKPQCNPMITVGDDPTYFDGVAKSSQEKVKLSSGGQKDQGGEEK